HLIDLDDALVVVRDNDGKVRLNQLHNLTLSGALSGGFWGLLLGAIFTLPVLGPAVVAIPFVSSIFGAGFGALNGTLMDIGVDDDFARSCGEKLTPGTSALFVLVRSATEDKVLDEIGPYGGDVLTTSLSREQEARIQKALRPIEEDYRRWEQAVQQDATSPRNTTQPTARA
ncbi:MAG: DUF1269 domain-containing protein, partial [Myxococcota bacterium]